MAFDKHRLTAVIANVRKPFDGAARCQVDMSESATCRVTPDALGRRGGVEVAVPVSGHGEALVEPGKFARPVVNHLFLEACRIASQIEGPPYESSRRRLVAYRRAVGPRKQR